MTASKIMDVIPRLPDCDGQAADAVSAYTHVKLEDAPRMLKTPKSECPDVWIRLPRHKWPNSWANMEDPVVPLERSFLWERQVEEDSVELGWEEVRHKWPNSWEKIEDPVVPLERSFLWERQFEEASLELGWE